MPTVTVPDSMESSKLNSATDSVEEHSKINSFSKASEVKSSIVPPITPRTDFALRQANHLVEKICKDHGVEAPKYSFANCLSGQEDQLAILSGSKHTSVLRLAEYLHKRGQIERDYAISIQKLNRSIVQTGDTDERLGQLIVMGEKTAAGHMDWARKIGEQRVVDELKTLCGENEEQKRYLLSEMKKYRAVWSKAVGAFEKVRKNRDKALKAADSAQLALDTALSRGNVSKSAISRLQEEVQQKNSRAQIARDEYNRAMSALTQRQNEIFKEHMPQCLEGFEKMERARIAAVRSSLIILAQVHLAVSDVEIESGQRWLKSLVSLSVDDEIEMFIENVEERAASGSRRILEDEYDAEGEKDEYEESEINVKEAKIKSNNGLYSNTTLTTSESDLLRIGTPEIEDSSDPSVLKERRNKLEGLQTKLGHQLEALEKMQEAYAQQENQATLEAVRTSIRGISKEIADNNAMIEQIEAKLSEIQVEEVKNNNSNYHSSLNMRNPMESIMEELNRLDNQRRTPLNAQLKMNSQSSETQQQRQPQQKKKALSRSFEDILNSGEEMTEIMEECASPKATGLKLPGAQWTAETISKSNEEVARSFTVDDDYFCAEEEELREERNRNAETKSFAQTQQTQQSQQAQSPRRKSIGQSTPSSSANSNANSSTLIPQNRRELFRVQALYNFIGRKETDELDLRTGEILSVYDANGEWWEAENEAGARGYIPFNYVIRI